MFIAHCAIFGCLDVLKLCKWQDFYKNPFSSVAWSKVEFYLTKVNNPETCCPNGMMSEWSSWVENVIM